MLLISFVQILPWLFGGLFILTIVLSLKGILSPILTIILLLFFGGSSFIFIPKPISLNDDKSSINIEKDRLPESSKNDNPIPKSKIEIEPETNNPKKEITPPKKKSSETENLSPDNNSIPQEYEVTDNRLWTYRINGYWKWDKSFVDYFEKETGWKKIKKGNYEITIQPGLQFSQKINDDERLYVHPGGEIEIRVNGKICCCKNTFSIPAGISHSQLVKAKGKLQDTISNLLLENKEKVVAQLRECL